MIILNNAKDPTQEIKKLDGEYFGVVCNVIWANPEEELPTKWYYYVTLYIPAIYGLYKQDAQNHPTVKIPFMFDNHKDDLEKTLIRKKYKALNRGHIPEIGDLYKVMFEDGKSHNCQIIYQVKISKQAQIINKNYIENGVLASGVIDKPEIIEPGILNEFKDMLDVAYFITTGHTMSELTYKDFTPCIYAPNVEQTDDWWSINKSRAKNIYCKALSMPFMSYFTGNIFDTAIPVNSSEHYSVMNMMNSIITQHSDYLVAFNKIFKQKSYDWTDDYLIWGNVNRAPSSPYVLYTDNKIKYTNVEDLMQCMLATGFCYINPKYISMLFPFVEDTGIFFGLSSNIGTFTRFYADYLWEYYGTDFNQNKISNYAFSKLLFRWKQQYEEEWLKFIQTVSSGLNYYGDKKLLHTMLLCITICPYMVYPMISYLSNVSTNAELNEVLLSRGEDPRDFRTYSTYIDTDDKFVKTTIKLKELAQSCINTRSYNSYIHGFKNIAKDIFGRALIYDDLKQKDVNPWIEDNIEMKFARLSSKLLRYLDNI